MKHLTFRLQLVTPLFLSGADQQAAELRPPSVRGALRFWFRAMVGGVVSGDWQKVRDFESRVWGSTSQASQVKLRLYGNFEIGKTEKLKPQKPGKDSSIDLNRLPWGSYPPQPGGPGGAYYLLYSPFLSPEKGSKQLQRPEYIAPGSSFDLVLSARSPQYLDLAVASLWLLVRLGGLGTRCRRGAGTLKFGDTHEAYKWQHDWGQTLDALPLVLPGSSEQLSEMLSNSLQVIAQVFQMFAQKSSVGETPEVPAFDVIALKSFVLGVVSPKSGQWNDWISALEGFGIFFRDWRKQERDKGNKSELRYFGLPLTGYDNKSRRASPLWIRPVELADGSYCVLIYVFNAQHTDKDVATPHIVARFLKDAKDHFDLRWVTPYELMGT
jgi:CRISPR-associated protein Cmr1